MIHTGQMPFAIVYVLLAIFFKKKGLQEENNHRHALQ